MYKIAQIDQKFQLFKGEQVIIDLCGAPGGWSQYLAQKLSKKSKIILIDLVRVFLPINNIICLQCDITTEDIISQVQKVLQLSNLSKVDSVVSDCSPKMGGNYAVDHPRQIYLLLHAFRIAVLLQADLFVAKAFDGIDLPAAKKTIKQGYKDLRFFKPKASRTKSAELYLVARSLISEYVPPKDF